jgi:L-fuculokinase
LHKLTGVFVTDTTMAGTTMLTDLKERCFSREILKSLDLDERKFPDLVEPGTIVGKVTRAAADMLGIPEGIPVVASGHDTQFAILASGAGVNQPVLSSGTWEILMTRTPAESLQLPARDSGITIELDARAGLVNPGIQWVASGVLEWFGKLLYPDISSSTGKYETMIAEASQVQPGCNGVRVIPELFGAGFWGREGNIGGFTHEVNREHIYRAAIESLCFSLRYGLEKLQSVSKHKATELICVGGGSKNTLWNQIRADVTDIPIKVLDMKETTALGAAMVSFTGTGVFSSTEEAFRTVINQYTVFEPGVNRSVYRDLYEEFVKRVMR